MKLKFDVPRSRPSCCTIRGKKGSRGRTKTVQIKHERNEGRLAAPVNLHLTASESLGRETEPGHSDSWKRFFIGSELMKLSSAALGHFRREKPASAAVEAFAKLSGLELGLRSSFEENLA